LKDKKLAKMILCPLYPFHVVLLYLCLLLPLFLAVVDTSEALPELKWNLTFYPNKIQKLEEFNFTEMKVPH
jgi:hypothetical protein